MKAWTAEIAADAPPTKSAEMYTIAMLLALELVIGDESQQVFSRALAWVTLVMIWGSMRCDDVQCALPHRTTLSNYGLRMVLGKSKTSGPDKVQKEVSVHVFRTVSLTGIDWLGIGYRLRKQTPLISQGLLCHGTFFRLEFYQETACLTFRVGFFDWQAFERFACSTKSSW